MGSNSARVLHLSEYFWLLVVSSGRARPFSADSPSFWNPSHFHTAMCSQSQSLCLLGEWCKAHLLVRADRKKNCLEGWLVGCLYFPEVSMSVCLTSESPEAIWVVIPPGNNYLLCFHDYSHLGSKISAAGFSHKYISKQVPSSLIFKYTGKTRFSTSFRSERVFFSDSLVIPIENFI